MTHIIISFIIDIRDFLYSKGAHNLSSGLLNGSMIKGSSPKVVGFRTYAKIVVSLYRKKSTFLAPLNCALKAFIFALKDSAEAFVLLLSK
jgi:hypothetical protein